jgi:hypothetical protein
VHVYHTARAPTNERTRRAVRARGNDARIARDYTRRVVVSSLIGVGGVW